MARRATSPRLIGRDGELAELVDAVLAEDPDRPLLLIAGEAGIGKTRLMTELAQRLSARADVPSEAIRVVRGSCLRLAEGELPFAPFLEVLDGLGSEGGALKAMDRLRRRLRGLEGTSAGASETRSMWFTEVRDLLVSVAGDGVLIVVLDDLHWADRSTLDLLLFLGRRLRGSRVLVLSAYRSDELHRRHPLRPILAELNRGYVRWSTELRALDDREVADQVTELLGTAEPSVVQAIVSRADGNPFFAEEIVALESGSRRLPASLRDVLLARLAAADPTARQVLAAVALIGRAVSAGTLARVLGLERSTVERSLGEAVDLAILVGAPDAPTYQFRHALLEEAVSDDLLAGDRVELHRRIAAELAGSEAVATGAVGRAELARHLDLAGDHEGAAAAYLEAADLAFRALGWPEGVAAFDRAATLLHGAATDSPLVERLQALAEPAAMAMHWTGATTRASALLRQEAAAAQAGGDRERAISILLTLANLLNDAGDEVDARSAAAAAMDLGPIDDTTQTGVTVLIARSGTRWMASRHRDALAASETALAAAEALGDPGLLFKALVHRAQARIALGHVDQGLDDASRARRLQDEHGWLDVHGQLSTNIGITLLDVGALRASRDFVQEGLEMNRRIGTEASWDPWNLPGLAAIDYLAGDWAQAEAHVTAARALDHRGIPTYFNEYVGAVLAAGRGDHAAAARSAARMAEHAPPPPGDYAAWVHLTRAIVAGARGDPQAQMEAAQSGLEAAEDIDSFVFRTWLALEAASGAADCAVARRGTRDSAAREAFVMRAHAAARLASDLDAGLVVPGVASVALSRANAGMAAQDAARAQGSDVPDAWQAVAAAFESLEMRPRVAEARFRAAAAALRAGRRSEAEASLRVAADLAGTIGMTVLGRRIEALARAARIELRPQGVDAPGEPAPDAASPPVDRWGLSTREREVLELIAAGRSNREIGEALFISPKTASVHVTHILDKLGVSTRVEAALLAGSADPVELPSDGIGLGS